MKYPGKCKMSILGMVILVLSGSSSGIPPDPAYAYSIGSPSDEEQLFVELINRARSDASEEARRLADTDDPDIQGAIVYFNVSTLEMLNQFSELEQSVEPLSINADLQEMSQLHTQDMLDNAFQGHVSSSNPPAPYSPGDELADRASNFPGYNYSLLGENVYAFGRSVEYAHASFEIDWQNGGPFGMLSPAWHRINIHNSIFKEIGVGVVLGTNPIPDTNNMVGPLLVTQCFGTQQQSPAFLTGVAYYDLNRNNFYDIGEGLGSLAVQTSAGPDWATTSASGGYSIPVSADGTYAISFAGNNLGDVSSVFTISGMRNVKVDLRLQYNAPNIIGTLHPVTGQASDYMIARVPAATAYRIRVFSEDFSSWQEGAENGTAEVTISASSAYQTIQGDYKNSGSYAFHLAHTIENPGESIVLQKEIVPSQDSSLQFSSRMMYATSDQMAVVEISDNDGAAWSVLYAQSGITNQQEPGFSSKSIPLAQYDEIPVRIRFRYIITGPSIYAETTSDYGWLIDDITVTNSSRIIAVSETQNAAPVFSFTPGADGPYLLQASAVNVSRILPYGAILRVSAGSQSATQLWRMNYFSGESLNDPSQESTVWGNEADPDHDGFSNYLEYALGGDPITPDAASIQPSLTRSGNLLKLQYVKRSNDVQYRVIGSPDLSEPTWSANGIIQSPDPDLSHVGTTIEAVTELNGSRGFLKLEVLPIN